MERDMVVVVVVVAVTVDLAVVGYEMRFFNEETCRW